MKGSYFKDGYSQEMNLSLSISNESGSGSITSVDTNVAILQTVVCMVVGPVGTILIYGIVQYERVGVDSQKRSVFNQLISALFVALEICVLTSTIPITIRCWTGPLGHIVGKTVSVIRRFIFTFLLVDTIEILIYKNLCLISPNCILKLNDYFWTAFLLAWNGIVAMASSNAEWYISSSNPRIYNFISGNEDVISAGGDSRVFIGLSFIILSLAVSYMIIKLKKCHEPEPHHPVPNPMFNNMTHNPALVSFLQILSLVFILSIVTIPGMFVTNKGPNGFILGNIPLVLTGLLGIPSLFYAFNANLRRFVLKEIKEVLGLDPNIVQPQSQSVWSVQLQQ